MARPDAIFPEWRVLAQRSLDTSRTALMQLATVTADSRPSVRTVVFRGFSSSSGLKFVTDARSAKMAGLTAWAEVCYYCAETRSQFRFTGAMDVAGTDAVGAPAAARRDQWAALSQSARRQFCWPPPGKTRAGDHQFQVDDHGEEPVKNFVLLVLECGQVDFYSTETQTREVFRRESGAETWDRRSVNP